MSSEGNITVIESFSADDTHALGVTLGQQAKPGDVCTLVGDLGVGKTVLTQGIAEGLGITEPINSPTFTIVQVYEEGRLPFYHFDVYRIGDIEEMDEIGYEDYFLSLIHIYVNVDDSEYVAANQLYGMSQTCKY